MFDLLPRLCLCVPHDLKGCSGYIIATALFLAGVYVIREKRRLKREASLERRRPKHLHIFPAE